MPIRKRYRIAFFFAQNAAISMSEISEALRDKGERTFEITDEELWSHKRYASEVLWRHDIDNNILTASVEGGEAV